MSEGTIIYGDAREPGMVPDGSVQAAVMSPPYFGLRHYGDSDREIGRGTQEQYIADIVAVMANVRDALTEDGTAWVNIGDTAAGSGGAGGDFNKTDGSKKDLPRYKQGLTTVPKGQWILIPQRVALALQEDGWYLRQWITWDKGQLRPESAAHTRRPGISSETILMLTKSTKYKFNPEFLKTSGMDSGNVWHFGPVKGKRNHMAPFPDELPRRCIGLSTDRGDTVLDPFSGSHTTNRVAEAMGRHGVGFDLYKYETIVGKEA